MGRSVGATIAEVSANCFTKTVGDFRAKRERVFITMEITASLFAFNKKDKESIQQGVIAVRVNVFRRVEHVF